MPIRPDKEVREALHSEIRELAPRLVTQVRSTVVLSSVKALRDAGHGPRYEARLPPAARERLFAIGAPSWLPLELAWTHYAACNALGLSNDEVLDLGARVAPAHVSGVGLVLRAARATGATPWSLLGETDRFWKRMYEGGRLEVRERGPKDCELVVRGQPLAHLTYWRLGLAGVLRAICAPLCQRVYVRDEVTRSDDGGPPQAVYRLAWV